MGYQDRVVRVMVLVLMSFCAFAKPTPAQDCPEAVGRLPWGGADKVAVSGDYVYFNIGARYGVTEL